MNNTTGDDAVRADRIAEARRLRTEEGLSKRRIADRFGVSTGLLTKWLQGTEAPEWTKRPNAKDDQREMARKLRREAHSVPEIAAELGVAKSTAYQWVRDIPLNAEMRRVLFAREHASDAEHAKMMAEARWAEYRQERDRRRAAVSASAAESIRALTAEDIVRLGALIYWCEGTKAKPWKRNPRVTFINSDVGLIKLFLAFLHVVGVESDRIDFRVAIHESADPEAAVVWWAKQVGADPTAFLRTTLKRHNPKTPRRNTGANYHGCLVVTVRRGQELYDRIEGWTAGVVRAAAEFLVDESPEFSEGRGVVG
jgi:transposase